MLSCRNAFIFDASYPSAFLRPSSGLNRSRRDVRATRMIIAAAMTSEEEILPSASPPSVCCLVSVADRGPREQIGSPMAEWSQFQPMLASNLRDEPDLLE